MTQKRLLLLALNELNFDLVRKYLDRSELPNFRRILASGVQRTCSENEYDDLEPWIQWVSAHTGLTAKEHGVFRLGDIVNKDLRQIFEKVEAAGYSVGAVSPMNAANRMRRPAYFVPDPWTRTPADPSFLSKRLAAALAQTVNDNSSGRVTLASAVTLLLTLLRFGRLRSSASYARLALSSRSAPWRKALFLDLLIHEVHLSLMSSRAPSFSTLFLNGAAHVQHHYLFNSAVIQPTSVGNPTWYASPLADPMLEMLEIYDGILGDYLSQTDTEILVATGLTQVPFDRIKFYYRLKDHSKFLQAVGIKHLSVQPRMTRDFLIEFESRGDCHEAEAKLSQIRMRADQQPVFGQLENRGTSLFVTLTYPNEITSSSIVDVGDLLVPIHQYVVFVALKNGMHSAEGFIACTDKLRSLMPRDAPHVKVIHDIVQQYFELPMHGGSFQSRAS